MQKVSLALVWLFVSFSFTAGAADTKPGADPVQVPPGLLIRDVRGQVQRPFFAEPGTLAVVFFVTTDCPVSNGYAQEIRRICEAYDGKAKCTLDYVDPTLTPRTVAQHLFEYNHGSYPAVIDTDQDLVKASGAQVTPEVLVVKPGGEIAYRGRIDNKFESLGRARQQITIHDLRDVLDALLAGKPVVAARTNPIGCYITPIEFFRKKR